MTHGRAAAPPPPADPTGPVLLYDGACGFCGAAVRLVLRHDRRGTLRFAALGSAYARRAVARHPGSESGDSMVWVEPAGAGAPERALVRSDAALRLAAYLGGPWRLLLTARAVPRAWRDAAYDLVARHRHRLGGAACVVPTAAQRARFLEEP